MNSKSICTALILTVALLLGFASVGFVEATGYPGYGPYSPEMSLYYFADETALYSALKAGYIDLSLYEATSAQYQNAITDPNIILCPVNKLDMRAFSLNNNETIATYRGVRIPTSYAHFRKALWCMVDRDFYTQVICGGFATPVYTAISAPLRSWVNGTAEDYVKTQYVYDILTASYYLDNSTIIGGNTNGFAQRAGDANPYYNPAVPGSAQYWRGYPAGHSKAGQRIDPVIFSARVDDGLRYAASVHLRDRMLMSGIPVNFISEPSSSAFLRVITRRDYMIYSSGWSTSRFATYSYSWYHTDNWKPGGSNYHVSLTSPGYATDLDTEASNVWYTKCMDQAIEAAKNVQGLSTQKYATFIPLWSSKAFFYYRNLYGITNMDGVGPENVYTFQAMRRADGGTPIRVGHKSPPTQINQIYSQWQWDASTMSLTQDDFMSLEPYNILNDQLWLAQDWTTAPGTTSSVVKSPTSTGNGAWTFPGLAYSSDNLYAQTSTDGDWQAYCDYGMQVGSVTGIKVGIEAYTLSATTNWRLNVTVSWDGGATWAENKTSSPLPTSDPNTVTWFDFSSATDWKSGKKVSNANFYVRVVALRDSGIGGTVRLDWIPINVTYSPNPAGQWTDPDDLTTKTWMRYWFRDDPVDGLSDTDAEWIKPGLAGGSVLDDFAPQWLGGGYEFNCWYYDTESAGWMYGGYKDIKHIICNPAGNYADVYFDVEDFWSQYRPYGRLIYAPLGVPGVGQYAGWKTSPLSRIETRTFTGPILRGTFLDTLTPVEGAARKIPQRANGAPVEVINMTINEVHAIKAATPHLYDPTTGLGAGGDYSIVGSGANGPRIRIFRSIPPLSTLKVTYWARGNPAGYWPGNLNLQTTLAGTGQWYMTDFLSGAGGYAQYKANQHHFMETPPPGEIDWYWNWLPGTQPRDGYYKLDIFDASYFSFALDGSGNYIPTYNWVPASDLFWPLGVTDSFDAVLMAGRFNTVFGSPKPNPPP